MEEIEEREGEEREREKREGTERGKKSYFKLQKKRTAEVYTRQIERKKNQTKNN